MSEFNGWKPTAIHELIAESVPGEWGTEGAPDTGVPVLRSTNFVDDGTIDYSDIAFRKVPVARLEKRRINAGTLLMEKAGGSSTRPAGRVVFCDRDFNGTASNFVEIITVREDHSPKYVFYLLYRNFHTGLVYKYQQQTTGIINFKIREYFEEIVEVPADKTEQSKIAEILSTVDRAIEQTEALIAKQQRIKTGLMQDLLTRGIDQHGNLRSEATHEFKDSPLGRIPVEWDLRPFFDCVSICEGQRDPKRDPYRDWILVAPDHIESCTGRLIEKETARDQGAISGKYEFAVGDIVYSKIRPYLRKAILADFKGLCSADMYPLKPKSGVKSEFMFATVLGERFSRYAESVSDRSGFPKINRTELSDFTIAVPSVDEQERMAATVNESANSILATNSNLQKLRSLKTALMQDLLTGEKRVTPLLEPAETT